MEALDNFISKTIAEILKPDEFVFRLIENKLEAKGIILTEEQKLQVKEQLRQSDLDDFNIRLTEEQEKRIENSHEGDLILDLESEVEFEGLESKIRQAISDATQEVLASISSSLLDEWKAQAPSLLKQQNKERVSHAKSIEKIWSKPLDLLEILLSVSLQTGAAFNEYYRPIAAKNNDTVFEVLTRLHVRGCQVGSEILLLLRNGFADGAHARWRTLHEITVIAKFIELHGNELAERYLHYSDILEYKAALSYQEHYGQLHYEPISQDTLDNLKARCDALVQRFGRSFKEKKEGWAASVLKEPNFAEIEKSVKLDYLRPFYKMANVNVHADSRSTYFRLGLPLDNDEILVAGPSVFGLGEPGQNTAFSIYHLTATLLLTRDSLDQIAFVSATHQLMNETVWGFDEVMETQERTAIYR